MKSAPRPPDRADSLRRGGSSEPSGPEVVLVVHDRPDALERLFGTVRRRGMDLQIISLGRFGDDLVLVLRREARGALPGRWLAELEDLVDVLEIRVASEPDSTTSDSSLEGDSR